MAISVSRAEYYARAAAGERIELADGEILPMPNNDSVHDFLKFDLCREIALRLGRAGWAGNEMCFELNPDLIRHPDIAVLLSRPRIQPHVRVQGAPDLAIEIVSDSDTAKSLDDRVNQFLAHGSQAVWVVWPESRRFDIHQRGQATRHIHSRIEGEIPIPAFTLDLAEFFEPLNG